MSDGKWTNAGYITYSKSGSDKLVIMVRKQRYVTNPVEVRKVLDRQIPYCSIRQPPVVQQKEKSLDPIVDIFYDGTGYGNRILVPHLAFWAQRAR